MAEVRRALRQTGVPPYEFDKMPLGKLVAAIDRTPPPFSEQAIGDFFQRAAPTINLAREDVVDSAKANIAAGNYAGAVGNVIRGAVTLPAAGAVDIVGRPAAMLSQGIGKIIGGALGISSKPLSEKVVKATPAAPVEKPVEKALAQGRAAVVPQQLSSQEALDKYITSVLSGGATIREAAALGPLVGQTVKQGQSAKNTVLGQTAALSQAIFDDQVGKIDAAVKAGTITAEQGVVGKEKATAAWFARNGGLVGFDPTKLALAQQLGVEEDE